MAVLSVTALFSFGLIAPPFNEKKPVNVHSFLERVFPDEKKETFVLEPLLGGCSANSIYKVSVGDRYYVLRVMRSGGRSFQEELELFVFLEASKIGVAPKVIATGADCRLVLMEYIDQKTLSLEESHLPENIIKLAESLRLVHQIPGGASGESISSKADRCVVAVSKNNWISSSQTEDALSLVKKYELELSSYPYSPVRLHGDLNPRNIFLAEGKALFIDWSETSLGDPLYDLSYLALKLDYDPAQEILLLESYFDRSLTGQEMIRYHLHKKIHLAFWSLTHLYLAQSLCEKKPEANYVDVNSSLNTWGYYQKVFADNREELFSQYFCDFSRLSYQRALED